MKKNKKIWLTIFILFSGLTIYYFYPDDKLPTDTQIDKIVVNKSKRQLLAYSDGKILKI